MFLPQLPPQPSSLRVRVWRRLQQLGAVALKNGAYVLPDTEEALEDFTWLRAEVVDVGGGALLLRSTVLEQGDAEIEQLFREERARDYRRLGEEIPPLLAALRLEKELPPAELVEAEGALRQLRARLAGIQAIDFFPDQAADAVERALQQAEAALEGRKGAVWPKPEPAATSGPAAGQLWITRAGVHVDRLACAWVIRRFLDPEARFQFVHPGESPSVAGIPFDMAGVELGHHGARCSVEVIAARYRPEDRALRAVAEVVHDLDLKDEGFGRPEAPGLKRLLEGVCVRTTDDLERIALAVPLFDALYAGFEDTAGTGR